MVELRVSSLVISFFLLLVSSVPLVYCDKGMIPIYHEVSVYEPGQKAIIAWNGLEEILVLSTDVTASNETMVLELLPLPSNPKVEAASFKSFEEIQNLIWEEGIKQFKFSTQSEARNRSVEVVFHEVIGAHNITIVRTGNIIELVNWIRQFLAANGISRTVSLGDFEEALKDYLGRGFRYYALDLITVTPSVKSVEPILYRFNSSFLYYPLAITNMVLGETKITLFLLTKEKVNGGYLPFERAYYKILGQSPKPIELQLSKGELSKIDLRIGELFDQKAWLTVLKYEGEISKLTYDLMITEKNFNSTEENFNLYDTINLEAALPFMLIALCIFLSAACMLASVFYASCLKIASLEKSGAKPTFMRTLPLFIIVPIGIFLVSIIITWHLLTEKFPAYSDVFWMGVQSGALSILSILLLILGLSLLYRVATKRL